MKTLKQLMRDLSMWEDEYDESEYMNIMVWDPATNNVSLYHSAERAAIPEDGRLAGVKPCHLARQVVNTWFRDYEWLVPAYMNTDEIAPTETLVSKVEANWPMVEVAINVNGREVPAWIDAAADSYRDRVIREWLKIEEGK